MRSNDLMVGDHVPIHVDRLPRVMSVAMNMVPQKTLQFTTVLGTVEYLRLMEW